MLLVVTHNLGIYVQSLDFFQFHKASQHLYYYHYYYVCCCCYYYY